MRDGKSWKIKKDTFEKPVIPGQSESVMLTAPKSKGAALNSQLSPRPKPKSSQLHDNEEQEWK